MSNEHSLSRGVCCRVTCKEAACKRLPSITVEALRSRRNMEYNATQAAADVHSRPRDDVGHHPCHVGHRRTRHVILTRPGHPPGARPSPHPLNLQAS